MTRGRASKRRSTGRVRRAAPATNIRHRRFPRFWLTPATRRKLYRAFRSAPPWAQLTVGFVVLAAAALLLNGLYQVVRKPSELFFPVSGTLYKSPKETWDSYALIFKRHSTATITPEFLAALAQIEGSGNPIVRTYWRFSLWSQPFEIYRPASSAVGMYQITDGTFAEARRYCIHDHVVVQDGPWNDPHSCWFNSLYARTVPSHAVELTSAYLDRHVARALGPLGMQRTSRSTAREPGRSHSSLRRRCRTPVRGSRAAPRSRPALWGSHGGGVCCQSARNGPGVLATFAGREQRLNPVPVTGCGIR